MTDEATVDAVEQIRSSLIGGILGACDMDLLGTVLEEVDDLIQAAEERGREAAERSYRDTYIGLEARAEAAEAQLAAMGRLLIGAQKLTESLEAQLAEARKQRDLLRKAARRYIRLEEQHPGPCGCSWHELQAALDATREGATAGSVVRAVSPETETLARKRWQDKANSDYEEARNA